MELKLKNNRVVLSEPPKSRLKLTATRFGTVLNANDWQTPFSAWAEISKVYRRPFIETPEIVAGRVIEPILIEAIKEIFGNLFGEVVDPKEFYGNLYDNVMIKKDFYPNEKVFGGMWDAKIVMGGKTTAVIECKTTRRAGDWLNGIPSEKLLQGLLYAELERIYANNNATEIPMLLMPVAFLRDEDYAHPEKFVPVEGKNFKVYVVNPNTETVALASGNYAIGDLVEKARKWYNEHVDTGVSPTFDEKKDKEILDAIGTKLIKEDETIDNILGVIDEKNKEIARIKELTNIDKLESDVADLTKKLKEIMMKTIGENKKLVCGGFTLSKSTSNTVDKDKMKEDGVLDKYMKTSVSYRLTYKENK